MDVWIVLSIIFGVLACYLLFMFVMMIIFKLKKQKEKKLSEEEFNKIFEQNNKQKQKDIKY